MLRLLIENIYPSKFRFVGTLMIVELKDVCEKETSNIRQKDLLDKKGDYPIYGASGLIGNVDFYRQETPYVAVVKDGAGIGRAMLLPAKSSVIGTMQYLIPKGNVLPEYLYYVVKNMHLEKYSSGATIPHIYFKYYKKEKFNLVDLDQQRKIISVFKKIEDAIRKQRDELTNLDTLIKARFVEMFGDPGLVHRENKVCNLENVAEVRSSHRIFTREFTKSGVPFYRGTEISLLANGKEPIHSYYISKARYDEITKNDSKPKIGDLLMPSICDKGQIWLVNTSKPFYYKDGRVLCISPNREKFNTIFFHQYMKMKSQIEYLKIGSGSTFAEFKIFQLKKLKINIPPLKLQNEFASFVQQVDKSKVVNNLIMKYIISTRGAS